MFKGIKELEAEIERLKNEIKQTSLALDSNKSCMPVDIAGVAQAIKQKAELWDWCCENLLAWDGYNMFSGKKGIKHTENIIFKAAVQAAKDK